MELIGIFIIACGLLVLAGVAKVVRPDDTARAFVLMLPEQLPRVPSFKAGRLAVRTGALVEAAVGASALLFPRPVTAALVAVSYTLFVCTVVYARRRGGPLSTCGCFGRPDTPATGLHVVLNAVFAAASVTVALRPSHFTTLASLLANQPWSGVPLLLACGAGVWLAYLALSPLATLEAARHLVGTPGRKAVSA
jgi:hypothetical protein